MFALRKSVVSWTICMLLALILGMLYGTPAAPQVRVVVGDSALQRVRCSPIWCSTARLLLHGRVTEGSLALLLVHDAAVNVQVERLDLALLGARSGEVLAVSPLLTRVSVPPAGLSINYPIVLKSASPDRYRGDVVVTIAGAAPPARSPLRLDVRQGPGWPVVLLILGIGFSRLLLPINKPDKFLDQLMHFFTAVPEPVHVAGETTHDKKKKCREMLVRRAGVFVFVLAAVIEGLEQVYVNDPSFGDSVLDYTTAFFWPFAADVMGRGVGNIKWPK
jgi:hypothetical protein